MNHMKATFSLTYTELVFNIQVLNFTFNSSVEKTSSYFTLNLFVEKISYDFTLNSSV